MDDVKQNDLEYALDWYDYGIKNRDDAIIRFMMYWIAFNWLYSACEGEHDADKIEEFCERYFDRLSGYPAFETEEFEVLRQKPIANVRTGGRNGWLRRRLYSDDELLRMKGLFRTIYHVRCNLFHGSKSIHNERDMNLVRASGIILEGYLKASLPDRSFFH